MILNVINPFLHHPSRDDDPQFYRGVVSGLILAKEKLMEARLQLPLEGMAKRQCLMTGIKF